MATTNFEVFVSKDTFKFNAAHFVAFHGYRERLHGHNYQVGVRLLGKRQIGADGYVIDFGNIKAVCKKVCKSLNEHFLCPIHSNVLSIAEEDGQVKIECQDQSVFSFPRSDCAMLPLVHATTEELSIFLWNEILSGLNAEYLLQRGIHTMEVTVAEAPGQSATFRWEIPTEAPALDVREFITTGKVIPMPCVEEKMACCPNCESRSKLSDQLAALAEAINEGTINKGTVTVDDIQKLIS